MVKDRIYLYPSSAALSIQNLHWRFVDYELDGPFLQVQRNRHLLECGCHSELSGQALTPGQWNGPILECGHYSELSGQALCTRAIKWTSPLVWVLFWTIWTAPLHQGNEMDPSFSMGIILNYLNSSFVTGPCNRPLLECRRYSELSGQALCTRAMKWTPPLVWVLFWTIWTVPLHQGNEMDPSLSVGAILNYLDSPLYPWLVSRQWNGPLPCSC